MISTAPVLFTFKLIKTIKATNNFQNPVLVTHFTKKTIRIDFHQSIQSIQMYKYINKEAKAV